MGHRLGLLGGGGLRNRPHPPPVMANVLVFGYATGVFSSRKLARKLHEDVAFRVLAAGNYPAHRTICDFRAFHLKELSDLFVQVVKLARECGLVKLGTVAIDGTKIKANASRHKAMSYERMKKREAELRAEVNRWLEAAEAADREEDRLYGERRGDEMPEWVADKQKRLQKIAEAKAALEAQAQAASGWAGLSWALDRNSEPKCSPQRGLDRAGLALMFCFNFIKKKKA